MAKDPFQLVGLTVGGKYAIQSVVAESPAGLVYRATDSNASIALKVFRPCDDDGPARRAIVRALVDEGSILADISTQTPGIARPREAVTLVAPSGDWLACIAIDDVEGPCLADVLRGEDRAGRARCDLTQAVAMLDPIAHALALAHDRGLAWGEISPEAIFVAGEPGRSACTTQVLDLGWRGARRLARQVGTGGARRLGAPAPEGSVEAHGRASTGDGVSDAVRGGAPEQMDEACGLPGPWTDVFGLASVLVTIVAGMDAAALRPAPLPSALSADDPVRAVIRSLGTGAGEAVEAVLLRALAVFPAERWQTVGSFWRALRAALATPPSRFDLIGGVPSERSPARRSESPTIRLGRLEHAMEYGSDLATSLLPGGPAVAGPLR